VKSEEWKVKNPYLCSVFYKFTSKTKDRKMKIALIGYGKMGKMIEQIARSRGHEIVSIIDIDNQEDFESEAFASADVAIEFTTPMTAYDNYLKAWKAGVKVVSGSTGWLKEHGEDVKKACTEGGKTLFWASNYSVGVAIFSAVNKYLANIMNAFPQYDVKEEETHHIHKLDYPSGTGITLAEQIVERLDRKKDWTMGYLQQPDGTVEGTDEVANDLLPISSIRRDEVPGIHSITWNSEADQITITHDAHSRQGFALGAVIAAEFTAQHEGLLSTDDLFKF
jgi:4-hydroxy-tetrahydrodipicolinate reductase